MSGFGEGEEGKEVVGGCGGYNVRGRIVWG
jgi:hypothetical protein